MTNHFKYSGSTIELTAACPGSVEARKEAGYTAPGAAAERGTRIHARVEDLLGGYAVSSMKNQDEEAIAHVLVDVIQTQARAMGYVPEDFHVEERLAMHQTHREAGGIPDLYAFRFCGDLWIPDIKTGRVPVYAQDNWQLAFYFVTIMQNLDELMRNSLGNVHFAILQPDSEAPFTVRVDVHTQSVADAYAYWEPKFAAAMQQADANPSLRIAGDHCMQKYCNARDICPARQEYINQASGGLLVKAMQGESVKHVRGHQLAAFLATKAAALDAYKCAEENAIEALKADKDSVPGWGLQDGLGNRTFTDEEAVEKGVKALKLKLDEFKPRYMLSPAQLEKLLKAKKLTFDLTPFVERPNTGVKLVAVKVADSTFAQFAPQEPPAP